EAHQGLLTFRREPRCCEKWRQVRRRTQVMVIPLPSPTTTAGAISRATLRAGPVFARCGVFRRSFGMTEFLSSCLASRKNRLRRGRGRNVYRPWARMRMSGLKLGLQAEFVAEIHFLDQLVGEDGLRIAFGDQLPIVDDIGGFAAIQGFAHVVIGD